MDASPGGWKQRSFTYQATVYIRECLCPIPIGHITETRNDHPEVLDSIRLYCPACATRWRLVLNHRMLREMQLSTPAEMHNREPATRSDPNLHSRNLAINKPG